MHHSSAHSKAKADTLVAELQKLAPGVKAAAFEADLSTYDNARKLHDEVVNVLGHPNILFINHGVTGPRIGPQGDIQDVSPEVFEEIWRTNNGTGYVVCSNTKIEGRRELMSPRVLSLLRSVCRTCKRRSGAESSSRRGNAQCPRV